MMYALRCSYVASCEDGDVLSDVPFLRSQACKIRFSWSLGVEVSGVSQGLALRVRGLGLP